MSDTSCRLYMCAQYFKLCSTRHLRITRVHALRNINKQKQAQSWRLDMGVENCHCEHMHIAASSKKPSSSTLPSPSIAFIIPCRTASGQLPQRRPESARRRHGHHVIVVCRSLFNYEREAIKLLAAQLVADAERVEVQVEGQ